MTLTLKDKNGLVKAEFGVSDNSVQEKELHGDNVLNVSFTLYEYIPIDVTDYVDYEGERYWAMGKYQPQEKSSVEWEYSFSLYGIESVINRFLVINYTDGGNDPEFTLTAPAADHARLIVKSINEGLGEELFSVGTVVSTGNIVIDYKGKYCVEGLSEVAKAADTEYWFDGYMLNLCRCERGEPLTMGYGNGLTRLSRDTASGSKFWTRLFPIGSTRNIDVERYGHSRLQLPGGARYVDKAVDKYGVWHHYEEGAFADIYPRRVGTVSSVRSEEKSGQDGKTFTIWYFKDNGLNFDPNDYEIGGLVKRVSFQEGSELAGLGGDDGHYFEVNYDSQKKEFEIITIWPYDDDTQLPGGMLVPKVGDEYILWNIRMPDSYYTLAEEELAEAVDQYIEDHWKDNSVYKGATDHVWVEERAAALYVGRRIRLESQEYFPEDGVRLSRITKVTRNVNLPSSMDIEISDSTASGFKTSVSNSIAEVRNYAQHLELTFPDIIKTGEEKTASDYNVWSALRSLREFLSTSREGSTSGLIGFVNGLWVKTKGLFGIDKDGNMRGLSLLVNRIWGISKDGLCKVASLTVNNKYGIGSNGNTTVGDISANSLGLPKGHGIDENGDAILHNVNTNNIVTKTLTAQDAHFFNLIIDEVKSVGGQMIVSPANAQIGRVFFYDKDGNIVDEDDTETPITSYYLWIKKEDDKGNAITMQFESGDLILHMEFNVAQAQTRNYWMRVEAALDNNYTMDFDGETRRPAYLLQITPTADQVKEGSARPRKGDHIAVFGNRSNAARQNAIVISAYNIPFIDPEPYNGDNNGIQAPLFVEYTGVGSWTKSEDKFKVKDANRKNVIARNGTRLRGDFMVYNSFAGGYTKVESLIQALENAITLRVASTSDALRGKQRNLWWNGDFLFWGEKLPLYHWYLAQGQGIECLSFEKITSELPAGFSTGIRMTLNEGYSTYTGLIGCSWDLEDARYKQPYFPLEVGKTYTFSFYARAPKNSSLYIELDTARYQALTSEWKRYSYSFTAVTSGASKIAIMGVQVGDYYLTGIQLEEGDTLTEWQPVIERMADMADSIAELKVTSDHISASVTSVTKRVTDEEKRDSANLIPQSTFPYGDRSENNKWFSTGSRAITAAGREHGGITGHLVDDPNAAYYPMVDARMGQCLYIKEHYPSTYVYPVYVGGMLIRNWGGGVLDERIHLDNGEWYTLSWFQKVEDGWFQILSLVNLHDPTEKVYVDGGARTAGDNTYQPSFQNDNGKGWVRHTITFKTRAEWLNANTQFEFLMYPASTTSDTTPAQYWLTRVQLERGKKATEWKPAGEDIGESINDVNTSITQQSQLILNTFRAELSVLQNNLLRAGIILDGASSRIDLIANKVRFVAADRQTPYILVGTDSGGFPHFKFLDPDGQVAYDLGYTGLTRITQTSHPQEWEPVGAMIGFSFNKQSTGMQAGSEYLCEYIWNEGGGTHLDGIESRDVYINHEPYFVNGQGQKTYPSGGEYEGLYYTDLRIDDTGTNPSYLPTGDYVADGWYAIYDHILGYRYYRLIYMSNGKPLETEYTIEMERLTIPGETTTYIYHGRIVEEIEGYTPAADDSYIKMPPIPV